MRTPALSALLFVLIGSTALAQTTVPPPSGSEAFSLSAQLVAARSPAASTAQPIETAFGATTVAHGSGEAAYDDVRKDSALNSTMALVAASPRPSLFVNASKLESEARSSGIKIDSILTEAFSKAGQLSLSVNLYPLPPGASVAFPQPLIDIEARDMRSDVSFARTFPDIAFANSETSVRRLAISGQALGSAVLSFSGQIAPNKVVYETPNVIVTLNRRVVEGVVTCNVSCSTSLRSIATDAVDIVLKKARFYNYLVSGEIRIGDTEAR